MINTFVIGFCAWMVLSIFADVLGGDEKWYTSSEKIHIKSKTV